MLHVDPSPFTLRELWWMVRGHDKDEWNRTSAIRAEVHNASEKYKRPVSPADFNPYAKGCGAKPGVKKVSFKQFVRGFSTERKRKHG